MEHRLNEENVQLVAFSLDKEEFACYIDDVREVLKLVQATPLPKSLDFVEGIINLRGEIIPLLNMRRRFNLPVGERTEASRIIVVEVSSKLLGLIVDSVSRVVRLPKSGIREAPAAVAGARTEIIHGVGKVDERLLIILNLEYLLSSEEKVSLNEIRAAGKQIAAGQQS